MLLFQHARRCQHLHAPSHQERLGILVPEGPQKFIAVEQPQSQSLQVHFCIHIQGRLKLAICRHRRDVGAEPIAKRLKVFFANAHARRHFMPAPGFQKVPAGIDSGDQGNPGDAAAAAFADPLFVEPDHKGGTVILLHDPRRHDAHHARMPSPCRHNHCAGPLLR